jgi:hypothetical protein
LGTLLTGVCFARPRPLSHQQLAAGSRARSSPASPPATDPPAALPVAGARNVPGRAICANSERPGSTSIASLGHLGSADRVIGAASSSTPPLITTARSRFFHRHCLDWNDGRTPYAIDRGNRHEERPSLPSFRDCFAGFLRTDDFDVEMSD